MSLVHAIGVAAAAFLATLFAYSGITKLVSGAAFHRTLRELLPASSPRTADILRFAVPILEVVLALLFLTPVSSIAAWAAIGLLLVFSFIALRNRSSGVSCACFGSASSAPLGLGTAVRNGMLIAVALIAGLAAPAWIWPAAAVVSAGQLLMIGIGTAAALLLAWTASQVATVRYQFANENAALRASITRLHRALSGSGPIERPIPPLQVRRLDGTWTTLSETVDSGPQLTLFSLEDCPACALFAQLVPGWRERLGNSAGVQVVFRGSLQAARREWGQDPNVYVLGRDGGEAALALGLLTYPAVMLLGGNGVIATDPLQSDQDIDELIDGILELSRPRES